LFPRSQTLPFGPLRESSTLIATQDSAAAASSLFGYGAWLVALCVFVYFLSASAMEDSVRRCPKCQIVLPELANYTVYQCVSCGTVLRGTLS